MDENPAINRQGAENENNRLDTRKFEKRKR
jgi:hypothetical protein